MNSHFRTISLVNFRSSSGQCAYNVPSGFVMLFFFVVLELELRSRQHFKVRGSLSGSEQVVNQNCNSYVSELSLLHLNLNTSIDLRLCEKYSNRLQNGIFDSVTLHQKAGSTYVAGQTYQTTLLYLQ